MGRKEIRQKQLIQIILDHGGIPATVFLAKELGVTERTIQNDLNDINALIPDAAVEDIRRMLMLRLRERLPEMSDVSLLKLAEFFLSRKTEAKVEAKVDVDAVLMPAVDWNSLTGEERDKLIEAAGILIDKRSGPKRPGDIH